MPRHAPSRTIETAGEIVSRFSERTGLSPAVRPPPRRYLWTDAFAVCNFLKLFARTGDAKYEAAALGLEAVGRLAQLLEDEPGRFAGADPVARRVAGLARHTPLRGRIEAFWLEPGNGGSPPGPSTSTSTR